MKKIVFLLLAMFTAFSLSFAFETRMDDDPYVKTFTLMVISQVNPPLHYEFLADYTGDAGSTAYYSMNWGNGGANNGMYLDNAFYPGADYSNSRTDMYLNPLN